MKVILLALYLLSQALVLFAQDFSFVYLPDIHLRPDPAVKAGFENMVSEVNRLHPDFVLTGGDMIYTAKTVNGQKAAALFDFMDNEFKLFNMPVRMTMGNHENVGITAESGIDKKNPDWGKQMFERRYNKRYYSFTYGGWKFFVLDGIKIREKEKDYTQGIDEEQIEWIRNELKATDPSTPLVLSMHTPFVSPHDVLSTDSGPVCNVCNSVLKMFDSYNLKIIFEGHTHLYMNLFYEGKYYLSGGSSEISTDEPHHGFLHVKVEKNNPVISFMRLEGPGN
ncbi:MAG: metallophosphoesterase family protein [Methanosarcina sp.]